MSHDLFSSRPFQNTATFLPMDISKCKNILKNGGSFKASKTNPSLFFHIQLVHLKIHRIVKEKVDVSNGNEINPQPYNQQRFQKQTIIKVQYINIQTNNKRIDFVCDQTVKSNTPKARGRERERDGKQ